jgi:integrase
MTSAHRHSRAAAEDTTIAEDALVYAQMPLREGTDLADTARYGQGIWDLSPVLLQKQQQGLKLDFATLPTRFQAVAKEFFYAQMAGELPEGERRPRTVTIRVEFTRLKIFLEWLDEHGYRTLSELGMGEVDAYRTDLVTRGMSPSWRLGLRRTVRKLWIYRGQLRTDRLGFDPATLDGWHEGTSKRTGENATDRIPEPVLGPLLGWALRYVQEFSVDILAARTEWAALYACHWHRRQGHRAPGSKTAQPHLVAVLDRYRAAGRLLPGGPAGLGYSHLAREVDVARSTLKCASNRVLIEHAVAELGIDDDAYLWTPMTADIGGRPWLERMPYRAYAFYEQRLAAACYIVIAYLSGMRDSEVKHLRRGCLTIDTDGGVHSEGRLARHKVTSLAFKGEGTPLGVEATWVVGAPVADAIRVLEQLQPPEQDWLFASLSTSRHHRGRRDGKPHTNQVLTVSATNEDIAGLITWINDYCARHDQPDRVPDVADRPARVTTGQFRRTLAWFIARRPGGTIAGAIAYRHHSVQMFEGYAGTSNSGFRTEVEAEQALARGEALAMMVERHEHEHLTGPAAEEAHARLHEYGRQVRFPGTLPRDRRQFAKLVAQHDPHVYPGRYVTCVHNPDRALCHNGTRKDPSLGDCQPLACRNVALTPDNLTTWQQHLATVDATLQPADALAPYVRDRLASRREDITRLVQPTDPEQDQP